MSFTPHPTYEGLLRQARAMDRIIKSMEATRSHLRDTNDQLVRQFLLIGVDEVEAERNTNEILTNENEKLRARVDELEHRIAAIGDRHPLDQKE